MKRISILFISILFTVAAFSQDTIIGFSFPTNSNISLNPNMGKLINSGFQITYYSSDTLANDTVYFTNGITAGEYAATSTHWDNGMNAKYWSIRFKAPQYANFLISSKLRAGGTNSPGPKDFKMQWKLNNGAFADITNGTITVGNDWTTGVENNLLIPSPTLATNDTITVRWIMTSNANVSGGNVASNGVCKIDDILVVGTSTVGINTNSTKEINIYPNPCNGIINITSPNAIKEVNVYTILGKQIYTTNFIKHNYTIDISGFGKGLYFVKIITEEGKSYTKKISVR